MVLTSGQARIRRLVNDALPAYQAATTEHERTALLHALQQQLAADGVIGRDRITGRSLSGTGVAHTYLDWLDTHGPGIQLADPVYEVNLDRFLYRYGLRRGPAWAGGARPDWTMRYLMQLGAHSPLSRTDFVVRYYEQSGILMAAERGHHRLLAHVLWGASTIKPGAIILHQERQIDEALNAALYTIEHWFRATPYHFEVADYHDRDELGRIRAFAIMTTPPERMLLRHYLEHLAQQPRWWGEDFRTRRFTIDWVLAQVEQVRRMQGVTRRHLKAQMWLRNRHTREGESPFEYWYINVYLARQAQDRARMVR